MRSTWKFVQLWHSRCLVRQPATSLLTHSASTAIQLPTHVLNWNFQGDLVKISTFLGTTTHEMFTNNILYWDRKKLQPTAFGDWIRFLSVQSKVLFKPLCWKSKSVSFSEKVYFLVAISDQIYNFSNLIDYFSLIEVESICIICFIIT